MYRGRLLRDLSIWVEKGLIEQSQATAIVKDYDDRPQSFSLGRVLSVLAALLVGAAILLLVASNWDAIPRLLRVVGLVGLIWAFYLGGAACETRGHTAVSASLLLLGTISFGGAMALIGQMYHLSGDQLTMILVWFVVGCIAAALFRASSLVILSGFLSWAYFGVYLEQSNWGWIGWSPLFVPLMAAAILALIYYTGAARARHQVYLLLIGWLTWLHSLNSSPAMAILFAACGFIAFLAVSVPASPVYSFMRNAGMAPPFYTFLVAVIGFVLIHMEIVETGPRLIALGLAVLGASVLAISVCGKDNGAVRYLAYAVFAGEMLYLASVTIGSIIGTSGFFLVSGLLVAVAAFLVIRLERRFQANTTGGEARSWAFRR
jgi:uncharacterized membrane protein